jgi:hypothetical protein
MERDWFLERLQLIAHDILTVGEREEKEKRRWTNIGPQGLSALSENEITASVHLEDVLISGIQVNKSLTCMNAQTMYTVIDSVVLKVIPCTLTSSPSSLTYTTLRYTEQIFSHKNGEIMRSILSFDQNKRSLELQPMERSYLGFLTHAAQVQKSSNSVANRC